jgi:hypothetical protein
LFKRAPWEEKRFRKLGTVSFQFTIHLLITIQDVRNMEITQTPALKGLTVVDGIMQMAI